MSRCRERKTPAYTGVISFLSSGDGGSRTPVRREDHPGSYMRILSFTPRPAVSDRQDAGRATSRSPAWRTRRNSPDAHEENIRLSCPKSAPLWSPTGETPRDGLPKGYLSSQCVVVVCTYSFSALLSCARRARHATWTILIPVESRSSP